jgi:hypothetical protein
MEQITLTGLGILLILASWRFMVVASLRDTCLDKLRELRNTADEFFEAHGTASASTAHVRRSLLSLLDAEIGNLKDFSMVHVVLYKIWADHHPSESRALGDQLQARFVTNDPEVARFVAEIRREATRAIASFVTRRHLIIWIAVFITIPVVVCHHGLNQAVKEVIEHGARWFKMRGGVQQSIEDSFFKMETSSQDGQRFA